MCNERGESAPWLRRATYTNIYQFILQTLLQRTATISCDLQKHYHRKSLMYRSYFSLQFCLQHSSCTNILHTNSNKCSPTHFEVSSITCVYMYLTKAVPNSLFLGMRALFILLNLHCSWTHALYHVNFYMNQSLHSSDSTTRNPKFQKANAVITQLKLNPELPLHPVFWALVRGFSKISLPSVATCQMLHSNNPRGEYNVCRNYNNWMILQCSPSNLDAFEIHRFRVRISRFTKLI